MAYPRQNQKTLQIALRANQYDNYTVFLMIPALLIVLAIFSLAIPGWWAKRILAQYSALVPGLPGTGGELAKTLLSRGGIIGVTVEMTESADHYDPEKKVIRLTPAIFNGKSLSAVAVAAHEVGHAIQDHEKYRLFELRTRLAHTYMTIEKASSLAFIAAPVVFAITRSPKGALLMALIAFAGIAMTAILRLITLPVEWDASFGKALPMLINGGYITRNQEPAIRKTLKACAYTYVAASIAGLFDLWRWLAILVRRT